ncbi:sigma-70 family RNA polymerase sigma factor [Streptomyces sp. NPDC006314]|uniref:sigma-70 family RNA polymerase sigma factor n=1 Tax=Streptomyces sp. NPDC006314 TaxID=3154475 RepID=UPI0033AA4B60
MAEGQAVEPAEVVSALVAERYGQMVGRARQWLRTFDVPSAWVDAEDVVQNALAGVLAHGEPVEKLRPYVFTVIEYEARRAARRYHSGLGYGSRDADVTLEYAGPADLCRTADLRLDIEAALSALPPRQRTAVLATKVLGLTQAETAEAMGTKPGTVATHVFRAVRTLKLAVGALAVVLTSWSVAWLRMGRQLAEPAAGGDPVKVLSSLAPRFLAWTAVSVLGSLLLWLALSWFVRILRRRRAARTERAEAEAAQARDPIQEPDLHSYEPIYTGDPTAPPL